uniref:Uncharacterized protein n=1 Tax=Strombidium inclinatum TaxID=197538 RepID=A0A7S3ISJ5_9SPIT
MTYVGDNESNFFKQFRPSTRGGAETASDADALTVATSAVEKLSVFSGAPTSVITRQVSDIASRLEKEQDMRKRLEEKIMKLKEELADNGRLIDMNKPPPKPIGEHC